MVYRCEQVLVQGQPHHLHSPQQAEQHFLLIPALLLALLLLALMLLALMLALLFALMLASFAKALVQHWWWFQMLLMTSLNVISLATITHL